ncbi:WxL domain-containing protein, partial [Enterobacter bugandensis]|nr:WxL domain-containing protein [Enterobacter bugandensis]
YTEAATIFADGRDEQLPQVAPEALESIQQTSEEELLKNVTTTYHFTENGQTAEKTVNVAIAGELTLSSVPTTIDFGAQKITTTTQTYWPDIQGDLIVKDTRGSERSPWRLTVKEQQSLSNGT